MRRAVSVAGAVPRLGVPALLALACVLLPAPAAHAAPAAGKPSPHGTRSPGNPHRATPSPTASPTPTARPTSGTVTSPVTASPAAQPAVPVPAPTRLVVGTQDGARRSPDAAAPDVTPARVAPRPTATPAIRVPKPPPAEDAPLVGSIARIATTRPQLPLGVLAAVVLFLLAQSRIDRRDPKLTVTESSSSAEVGFGPPVRRRDTPRRAVPLVVRVRRSEVSAPVSAVSLPLPDDPGVAPN